MWRGLATFLTSLQQTKPRMNHIRGSLGTAGACGLEVLTPRAACVFLNDLPACEFQLPYGAQHGPSYKRDSPAWLPVALCWCPGGPFQSCTCPGCADLPDALLEPGFATSRSLSLLPSSSVLPDTLGKSAPPSAPEEPGLCGAKLLLLDGACCPGGVRAGCWPCSGSRESPRFCSGRHGWAFPLSIGTADKRRNVKCLGPGGWRCRMRLGGKSPRSANLEKPRLEPARRASWALLLTGF